jgi:hypothetical protein
METKQITVTLDQLTLIQGCLMNVRDQDDAGDSEEQRKEAAEIDELLVALARQRWLAPVTG